MIVVARLGILVAFVPSVGGASVRTRGNDDDNTLIARNAANRVLVVGEEEEAA